MKSISPAKKSTFVRKPSQLCSFWHCLPQHWHQLRQISEMSTHVRIHNSETLSIKWFRKALRRRLLFLFLLFHWFYSWALDFIFLAYILFTLLLLFLGVPAWMFFYRICIALLFYSWFLCFPLLEKILSSEQLRSYIFKSPVPHLASLSSSC